MSTTWSNNISSSNTHKLCTSTSVLAYIDNTLWIAKSQQQLHQILKTAESFYNIAKIQVNPQKSILISNTKTYCQIPFMNTIITSIPWDTPFKFLGC